MNLNKVIILFLTLVLNFHLVSGQWNIQTGYDFGTFTIPVTQRKNFNKIHRVNLVGEYIFKNNILVNLNTGVDFHLIDYHSTSRITDPSGNNSTESISTKDINIQNFRIGLSLGYQFKINNISSIKLNLSYDQYFVNHLVINESFRIKNSYDVPADEIDYNEPNIQTYEFSPRLDYQRFGYRNKFVIDNRNIIFSLGYRHQMDNFFVNPSLGFSPLNTGFILFRRQNLFLFGINLGFTLPQKNKNNEK